MYLLGGGKNGKSFNKIMLNIEKKFSTIRVVNDQTDIPIYILDLSVLLVNMVEKEQCGYYHATNESGFTSMPT